MELIKFTKILKLMEEQFDINAEFQISEEKEGKPIVKENKIFISTKHELISGLPKEE
jgi:hypothetical protein